MFQIRKELTNSAARQIADAAAPENPVQAE